MKQSKIIDTTDTYQSPRLAPVPAVCLAPLLGVWRCVSPADLSLVDLLGSRHCSSSSCVFGLDPSDLRYSSSATVPILVH